MTERGRYWRGDVPSIDDFNQRIFTVFYDAPTWQGPWAIMAPGSWAEYGAARGQRYELQPDGRWMKTHG